MKASFFLKLTKSRQFPGGCLLLLSIALVVSAQDNYKNLKDQAEEIGKAAAAEDFDRVVELTNPKLVKLVGGREKMITALRETVADLRKEGAAVLKQTVEPPSQVLKVGGEIFAVVPIAMHFKIPGGVGVEPSCLVGVSTDSGQHWTFVDVGTRRDPQMLRTLFPTVADKLQLPPIGKAVFTSDADLPKKP